MVFYDELLTLADEVIEVAVNARAVELIEEFNAKPTPETEEQWREREEVTSPESMARYRTEFEWIKELFTRFKGIDQYGGSAVTQHFRQLVRLSFDQTDADAPVQDIPPHQFEEHTDLVSIIDRSHGQAFYAFTDNFLKDLYPMWQNQRNIARSLAESSWVVYEMEQRARSDAANLAKEAKKSFYAIYQGGSSVNEGVMLNIWGVAIGLAGFVPVLSLGAGVLGLVTGLVGVLSSPESKNPPEASKIITGSTTADVNDSLKTELDTVVSKLGEAETKMSSLLGELNTTLEDPEVLRLVVASDLSYPTVKPDGTIA